MNEKTRKIIGWVLSGLLTLALLGSAAAKFSGQADEQMSASGFTDEEVMMIAVGELISAILFIIPKTSSLGTLLLGSYFGGAIVTHMLTPPPNDSYLAPAIFLILIWVTGWVRNPDLLSSFKK